MPRYVSQGFSLFLQLGGSITAIVVSTRRHSRDLPQGGLEIPCQYTLEGPTNEVKKIRIFLAACKSNYKLVNSDSVSNDNVIKTVPVKTEPQINDLVQKAATSTAASDKTEDKTIFVKQDCVVSFGEKSTECNNTWVTLGFLSLMTGTFCSMNYISEGSVSHINGVWSSFLDFTASFVEK